MEVGIFDRESLPVYRSLLLPEAVRALEKGEPLTVLGLAEGPLACGAAAGYLEDWYFRLISLYVAPDYRRRGGGRMLMETLVSILKQFGKAWGIEVAFTTTDPEHEELVCFLEALGFMEEDDRGENIYFATLSNAASSPFFSGKSAGGREILPFSKIPDICLSMAERYADSKDAPLPEEHLDSRNLERDVSTALVRNDIVKAFVVFDHSCCDRLTLSCAFTGDREPTALPLLLRESFRLAKEKYPPDTPIAVQAVNSASADLVRFLLPGAIPVSHTYIGLLEQIKTEKGGKAYGRT